MAQNQSQALTTETPKATTIRTFLLKPEVKDQIMMALPSTGLTPERLTRVAITSIMLNPKLQGCTLDSLVRSIVLSAQYGVLPDGRQAHLIPYGNVATFQFDYKGLMALVRRDPNVGSYFVDVAFEGDRFEIISGSERRIVHAPNLKAARTKESAICFYSIITWKSGDIDFEYMTPGEVEEVRQRFSKAKDSDAWKYSWIEMAKKTVIHRHLKKVDINPMVSQAVQVDMMGETGASQKGMVAMNAAMFGDSALPLEGDFIAPEIQIEHFTDALQDYDQAKVQAFLDLCAKSENVTIDEVKASAMSDLDGFKKALTDWIQKTEKPKGSRGKKGEPQDQTGEQEPPKTNGNGKAKAITADQAQEINKTLTEFQLSAAAFKRQFNVENITDLAAEQYEEATKWLNLEIDKQR